MAIVRKPGSNAQPKPTDAKAEAFIAGAANPQPVATPTTSELVPAADDTKRKPAMIRFDPTLLARVDRAAKRRGISRSAWIQYTLSCALDNEEV